MRKVRRKRNMQFRLSKPVISGREREECFCGAEEISAREEVQMYKNTVLESRERNYHDEKVVWFSVRLETLLKPELLRNYIINNKRFKI